MEAVQPKIDELQAKLDALSGMQTEMKATLSSVSATKPTTHKPTEKVVNLGKQNTKANVSGTESRIMAMLSK
jgi:prefoldin subunit 5